MKRQELAPAKVNLTLDVGARRPDGYHEVVSVMQSVALYDTVTMESGMGEGISLTCDDAAIPADGSNLAWRAAEVFFRTTGVACDGLHITLEKSIPSQAGLGGGSSDAACVLSALNELEHGGLSRRRLAELAGEIGSDVGFFIYGMACRCTGRGEKVEPLPEWREWRPRIVLLKPSFSVSTPDAYRRWAGSRELPGIPYGEQRVDGHVLVNDLERPVIEKHLFLAEMKRWLLERPGVRGAMMSGSGSTMFAVAEDEEAARTLMEDAARELDPTLWMWSGLVMREGAR